MPLDTLSSKLQFVFNTFRYFLNVDSILYYLNITAPRKIMHPKLEYIRSSVKTAGFSEESLAAAPSWQPQPSDVAISTYPKSGTTWMQQICHQLRSGGHTDFVEILDVVPFFEECFDLDKEELEKSQEPYGPPRLFKTHFDGKFIPKFERAIYVVRDPEDVAVSYYNYINGMYMKKDAVTLDEFTEGCMLSFTSTASFATYMEEEHNVFIHTLSWLKKIEDKDSNMKVLMLFYEDLKEDLEREVTKIAKFLSTDEKRFDSPENIAKAVENSSFAYMKEHADKFGGAHCREKYNQAKGTSTPSYTKVKNGTVGQGKKLLKDETKAKIQAKWMEYMEPATGCANYDEFRKKYSKK